jgi:hypothetical protein
MVAICRPASGVCAATEYVFGAGHSTDAAAAYCGARFTTTEIPEALYSDGTNTGGKVWTSATYATNWQMIAVKFTTNSKSLSVDGAAWATVSTGTLVFPADAGKTTQNRFGLGCRPASTPSAVFNGDILAAWAYYDETYSGLDDAWISTLYNSGDPWSMFLSTSDLTDKQVQFYKRPSTLLRM